MASRGNGGAQGASGADGGAAGTGGGTTGDGTGGSPAKGAASASGAGGAGRDPARAHAMAPALTSLGAKLKTDIKDDRAVGKERLDAMLDLFYGAAAAVGVQRPATKEEAADIDGLAAAADGASGATPLGGGQGRADPAASPAADPHDEVFLVEATCEMAAAAVSVRVLLDDYGVWLMRLMADALRILVPRITRVYDGAVATRAGAEAAGGKAGGAGGDDGVPYKAGAGERMAATLQAVLDYKSRFHAHHGAGDPPFAETKAPDGTTVDADAESIGEFERADREWRRGLKASSAVDALHGTSLLWLRARVVQASDLRGLLVSFDGKRASHDRWLSRWSPQLARPQSRYVALYDPAKPEHAWRAQLAVGDAIDALDTVSKWYNAKVVKVRQAPVRPPAPAPDSVPPPAGAAPAGAAPAGGEPAAEAASAAGSDGAPADAAGAATTTTAEDGAAPDAAASASAAAGASAPAGGVGEGDAAAAAAAAAASDGAAAPAAEPAAAASAEAEAAGAKAGGVPDGEGEGEGDDESKAGPDAEAEAKAKAEAEAKAKADAEAAAEAAVPKVTTHIFVTYAGWLSTYDEWLPVDGERIAPHNSRACVKGTFGLGEADLVNDCDFCDDSEDAARCGAVGGDGDGAVDGAGDAVGDGDGGGVAAGGSARAREGPYALFREREMGSREYVTLVNLWGRLGGYRAVLARVQDTGGTEGGDEASTGAGAATAVGAGAAAGGDDSGSGGGGCSGGCSGGGGGGCSGGDEHAIGSRERPRPLAATLATLVGAVGKTCTVMARPFAERYTRRLGTAVLDCVLGMDDAQLKCLQVAADLTGAGRAARDVLRRLLPPSAAGELLEAASLRLALKLFHCGNMPLRLQGLKIVLDAVAAVKSKAATAPTREGLCKWLVDTRLLEQVYDVRTSHIEYMRRGTELVKFLLSHDALPVPMVDVIWAPSAVDQEHTIVTYKVLEDLSYSFTLPHLERVLTKLGEIPAEAYSLETINLTKRISGLTQHGTKLAPAAMGVLWAAAVDSKEVVLPAVAAAAQAKLSELLSLHSWREQRLPFALKCVEYLKEHRGATAVLEILWEIIDAYYATAIATDPFTKASVATHLHESADLLPAVLADMHHYKARAREAAVAVRAAATPAATPGGGGGGGGSGEGGVGGGTPGSRAGRSGAAVSTPPRTPASQAGAAASAGGASGNGVTPVAAADGAAAPVGAGSGSGDDAGADGASLRTPGGGRGVGAGAGDSGAGGDGGEEGRPGLRDADARVNEMEVCDRTPHLAQVKARLDFLYNVLSVSTLTLNAEQVDALWADLYEGALTPQEREAFLDWLTRASTKTTRTTATAFDDEVVTHLFKARLLGAMGDAANVTPAGFRCLRTYFLLVNFKGGALERVGANNFHVVEPLAKIEGLETLWRVALEATAASVVTSAVDFLNEVHQQLGPSMAKHRAEVQVEYIGALMRRVDQNLPKAARPGGAAPAPTPAEARVVSRCLSVLERLLDEADRLGESEGQLRAHANRLRGRRFAVKLQSSFTPRRPRLPEKCELLVWSSATVADLRRAIAARADLEFAAVRLYHAGKELHDVMNARTMADLKAGEGAAFSASLKATGESSAPLLANPGAAPSKLQLSKAAEAALLTIFNKYGPRGVLSAEEIASYFLACGAGETNVRPERLKQIFKDVEVDEHGDMTRRGFLQFYTVAASSRPQCVWSDLATHGYDNQLQSAEEQAALKKLLASAGLTSPRSILMQNQSHFDCLFRVLEAPPELADRAWTILQRIPTNPRTMQRLRGIADLVAPRDAGRASGPAAPLSPGKGGDGKGGVDWEALVGSTHASPFRLMYSMQVMEGLIEGESAAEAASAAPPAPAGEAAEAASAAGAGAGAADASAPADGAKAAEADATAGASEGAGAGAGEGEGKGETDAPAAAAAPAGDDAMVVFNIPDVVGDKAKDKDKAAGKAKADGDGGGGGAAADGIPEEKKADGAGDGGSGGGSLGGGGGGAASAAGAGGGGTGGGGGGTHAGGGAVAAEGEGDAEGKAAAEAEAAATAATAKSDADAEAEAKAKADAEAEAEAEAEASPGAAWLRAFVALGGFEHMYGLLMQRTGPAGLLGGSSAAASAAPASASTSTSSPVAGDAGPSAAAPAKPATALVVKLVRRLLVGALALQLPALAPTLGIVRQTSELQDIGIDSASVSSTDSDVAAPGGTGGSQAAGESESKASGGGGGDSPSSTSAAAGDVMVGPAPRPDDGKDADGKAGGKDGDKDKDGAEAPARDPVAEALDPTTADRIVAAVDFAALQTRLVELLWGLGAAASASDANGGSSGGGGGSGSFGGVGDSMATLVEHALGLWVAAVMRDRSLLARLVDAPGGAAKLRGVVRSLLFYGGSVRVRREMAHAIYHICANPNPDAGGGEASTSGAASSSVHRPHTYFLDMLLDFLPPAGSGGGDAAAHSEQFFNLLNRLLQDVASANASANGSGSTKAGAEDPAAEGKAPRGDADVNKRFRPLLADLAARLKAHPYVEKRDSEHRDRALGGLILTLTTLLNADPSFRTWAGGNGEGQLGLVDEVFGACLFRKSASAADLDESDHASPPRCKTKESRAMAFKLLSTLCAGSPANATRVISLLTPIQAAVAPVTGWKYSIDREKRSAAGYVGVKNLGCICYMNAMLQQFYINPRFRYGVLSVADAATADASSSSSDEGEADADDPAETGDADGDDAKGKGKGKGDAERDGDAKSDDGTAVASAKPSLTERRANSVLYQLQRMYGFLSMSQRQDYHPKGWCDAFKDAGGNPVNVMVQQDAEEFVNVFLDRVEELLKPTPQRSLVHRLFVGSVENQIICTNCAHVKGNTEIFKHISLEVKNLANVADSLDQFVNGETISGFHCSACNKTVDIVKRVCLRRLPRTLILHCKRITFNFDTFVNEKINTRFEFPELLDLWPYTVDGLEAQGKGAKDIARRSAGGDAGAEAGEAGGAGTGPGPAGAAGAAGGAVDESTGKVREDGDDEGGEGAGGEGEGVGAGGGGGGGGGGEGGNGGASPGKAGGAAGKGGKRGKGPRRLEDFPPDHFAFRLTGVLCHTGTADSGHYYSFIRDPMTSTWNEFNDSVVRPFDPKDIEKQCFGGEQEEDEVNVWGHERTYKKEQIKNAYMCIYERVAPEDAEVEAAAAAELQEVAKGGEGGVADLTEAEVLQLLRPPTNADFEKASLARAGPGGGGGADGDGDGAAIDADADAEAEGEAAAEGGGGDGGDGGDGSDGSDGEKPPSRLDRARDLEATRYLARVLALASQPKHRLAVEQAVTSPTVFGEAFRDNLQFIADQQVYSREYFAFVADLAEGVEPLVAACDDYAAGPALEKLVARASADACAATADGDVLAVPPEAARPLTEPPAFGFGLVCLLTDFLLNILSHADDNATFKRLAGSLGALYRRHVPACQHLLTRMVEHPTAAVDLLLGCSNDTVRDCVCELLRTAMATLAPLEQAFFLEEVPMGSGAAGDAEAADAADKDKDKDKGKDAGASGDKGAGAAAGSSGSGSGSAGGDAAGGVTRPRALTARFLERLLGSLDEAASNWPRMKQFFGLLLAAAQMGHEQRAFLVRHRAVALLGEFFLGDLAPSVKAGGPKRSSMGNRVTQPDFGNLLACLGVLVTHSVPYRAKPPTASPAGTGASAPPMVAPRARPLPPTLKPPRHAPRDAAAAEATGAAGDAGDVGDVSLPELGPGDMTVLECTDIYAACLRNAMAVSTVEELVCHLGWENLQFSRALADVLVKGIDVAPTDSMAPYWSVVKAFVAMRDSLHLRRIAMVLGDPHVGTALAGAGLGIKPPPSPSAATSGDAAPAAAAAATSAAASAAASAGAAEAGAASSEAASSDAAAPSGSAGAAGAGADDDAAAVPDAAPAADDPFARTYDRLDMVGVGSGVLMVMFRRKGVNERAVHRCVTSMFEVAREVPAVMGYVARLPPLPEQGSADRFVDWVFQFLHRYLEAQVKMSMSPTLQVSTTESLRAFEAEEAAWDAAGLGLAGGPGARLHKHERVDKLLALVHAKELGVSQSKGVHALVLEYVDPDDGLRHLTFRAFNSRDVPIKFEFHFSEPAEGGYINFLYPPKEELPLRYRIEARGTLYAFDAAALRNEVPEWGPYYYNWTFATDIPPAAAAPAAAVAAAPGTAAAADAAAPSGDPTATPGRDSATRSASAGAAPGGSRSDPPRHGRRAAVDPTAPVADPSMKGNVRFDDLAIVPVDNDGIAYDVPAGPQLPGVRRGGMSPDLARELAQHAGARESQMRSSTPPASSGSAAAADDVDKESGQWACGACTLLNDITTNICSICGTMRGHTM